jgi:hypothetical protein
MRHKNFLLPGVIAAGLLAGTVAHAQGMAASAAALPSGSPAAGWQSCQAMRQDPVAQLSCF